MLRASLTHDDKTSTQVFEEHRRKTGTVPNGNGRRGTVPFFETQARGLAGGQCLGRAAQVAAPGEVLYIGR